MSGVTRWEVDGEQRTGLGARYRMLMRVGSAEVGGLIEVVEWDEPRDMAWTSVTGVDQRGRWRLRELDDGRTRVELRFAYGVAGAGITGWIAELVAAPQLGGHLRRSLHQLKRQVEHERLRAEAARRRASASSAAGQARSALYPAGLTAASSCFLFIRERPAIFELLGVGCRAARASGRRGPARARALAAATARARCRWVELRERCRDSPERARLLVDGPRGDLLGAALGGDPTLALARS